MTERNFLLILVLFIFGFSISPVNAQFNDATVSGNQQQTTYTNSKEIHPLPIPMDQRAPRINTPIQGDEYGSYNYNAFVNTGSGGGYVAAPSTFNENVDGAVECWVYPTATTSSAPFIIAKGDATAVSFGLLWLNTGSIGFRIGSTYTACTVTGNVPLNQWTHVGASWTGGPGAFVVTFFVNGAVAGTSVPNGGTWAVNSDSLTIGSSRAPFAGKDFFGRIDEVKIWTSPRTAVEIATNRFVGLGDGANANSGGALTSSSSYAGLLNSYTFNTGTAAYEDISGNTGYYRKGATPTYTSHSSNPLPYNYALKLSGGANDFVTVPTNTAFNQTGAGSIDAWVRLNAVGTLQGICTKGTTFANHNFAFYISSANKLGLNIGAHNYISTGPTVFAANKWYHVAATWSGGPNFTVKLYVNGVLDYTQTYNLAMPTNSDPFLIGKYYSATGYLNGYIDELRVWGNALTPAQIAMYMHTSSRTTGFLAGCVAAWNFDGNLNNFASTTGINGSFSTGGTNNARFSAFTNEATTGAQTVSFVAHPTVLNRTGASNPFPTGFAMKLSNKPIPDNATTKDTIKFATSRAITSVELFLAIQHTWVSDLTITLTAPNGTSRSVIAGAGGSGDNILTFFVDGETTASTAGFFAPWSYLAGPAVTFGNFGSANMLGNWVLSCSDGVTGDPGILQSWGLRFNGDVVTGVTPISTETPAKFELSQNYPNPFNPVTKIAYALPKSGLVTLKVYDVLGREVVTLVNEVKNAGNHTFDFNATNYSSGAYFYKLESNGFSDIKKMMLIK